MIEKLIITYYNHLFSAMLHAHKPLIKVMEFVGQSGTKGKKGLTQKEQLEVVNQFHGKKDFFFIKSTSILFLGQAV